MRSVLLLTIGFLLWPASLWAADDLDSARNSLKQIRQRIDQTLANIESATESEMTLVDELTSLGRQVRTSERRLKRLKTQLERLAKDLIAAQQEVRDAKRQVRETRRDVERRLVALYKEGEVGPLRILFSRTSPTDMAWQYEYLTRVVSHDRDLLKTYRQQVLKQQQSLEALETLQGKKKDALRRQQGHRRLLADASDMKKRLLARVQKDQTLLTTLLGRLENQAGQLQGLVKKLESEKPAEYTQTNGEFSGQKGLLDWPAPGKILVGYGRQKHPQLGTLFQSRGLELGLKRGTAVQAIWHGKVVYSAQFQGYGNLMIVDHGSGYHSLYARLAKLEKRPGELVEKGEQLAVAEQGHTTLYFEIRHKGAPTNPRSWLGARRK